MITEISIQDIIITLTIGIISFILATYIFDKLEERKAKKELNK